MTETPPPSPRPAAETPGRRRPPGRRSGRSGAREAILDAARALFAERGMDHASLRAIAASADVDPALIRHYFGDKQTLFLTVLSDRTRIPERLRGVFAGDPAGIGERLADAYLQMWDEEETRPVLMTMVRSATTSEHGAEMLREILLPQATKAAGPQFDDRRLEGLALAASHLFGTAFALHVLRLPMLVAMPHDQLVRRLAPSLQGYLAGPAD